MDATSMNASSQTKALLVEGHWAPSAFQMNPFKLIPSYTDCSEYVDMGALAIDEYA